MSHGADIEQAMYSGKPDEGRGEPRVIRAN